MSSRQKHCDYTFALSDISQCERLISELDDFPIWAYIRHDADDENGSDHYHFYIHLQQPLTISNLSQKLDIPENMIEWVRVKTKLIQYLIHKNNPEKKQYNPEEIITSNREWLNRFLFPELISKVNIHQELDDFADLASGRITIHNFLDKHSDQISNMSFYTRSLYLMRVFNLGKEGSISYKSRYMKPDTFYH